MAKSEADELKAHKLTELMADWKRLCSGWTPAGILADIRARKAATIARRVQLKALGIDRHNCTGEHASIFTEQLD
jgi:hypothetical protein